MLKMNLDSIFRKGQYLLSVLLLSYLLSGKIGLCADCPENFSPCSCDPFQGLSITCINVPLDQVKSVLNRTTMRDITRLELTINSDKVPANLLSGKRINIIRIICSSTSLKLKVHQHAFDSSSGYTGAFYIDGCDIRLLDMSFLTKFNNIASIGIFDSSNVLSLRGPLLNLTNRKK